MQEQDCRAIPKDVCSIPLPTILLKAAEDDRSLEMTTISALGPHTHSQVLNQTKLIQH